MIIIVLAIIVDYFVGDPNGWYHPVIAIGNMIKSYEKILYSKDHGKFCGLLLVIGVLATITVFIVGVRYLLGFNQFLLFVFDVYAVFAGLAFKSLIDASKSVRKEFSHIDSNEEDTSSQEYLDIEAQSLDNARSKIAMFVSRQTDKLTKEQILKTLIETVSENTIDGIVSPLFYAIIGQFFFGQGVLFIWLYKGINTMDSMIAYKNDKYMDFGFVAAKVDDLANLLPARLGSLIMLAAGGFLKLDLRNGYKILVRDHKKSVSPNAGYPESVTAGLLGISLGGLYPYFGKMIEKPIIGEDKVEVSVQSVIDTERIVLLTLNIIFILVVIMAI